jgi:hypothetical protein
MSIEDYAALERSLGTRLVRVGGVWWRRVRPLFYRPLFPFEPLPVGVAAPRRGRLGGWQHAVAPGGPCNSHLNYMIVRDPRAYDTASLNREDRNNLKRARQLSYRRLTDLEEFATEGHRVLADFFGRSAYRFRRDRLRPAVFRRWAAALLAEPRVLVLGAFSNEGLCEVHVSFRVQGVLCFDVAFASRHGRHLRSSYGVLNYLRQLAAQTDASFINLGPAGMNEHLDGFKLRRGATIYSVPALLRVNPVACLLLGLARPGSLRRLLGMNDEAAARYVALCP